ncbi:hypothetical protein [Gordonia phthalatica]|uniref:Uncharacterized protein n=1 Tax=Gordonia phthalatica TaxID=1136941 RepID=A0A0N7FUY2_9ACTN|nr:hypothetical protein [Gordonia phthalatica]ALG85631.1 hypothetical protein ACH46_15520 [Gordonia phthalatica]
MQVGDYDDYQVELYDASGKRTAVAPKGWRVVDYASTGGMTATFDPATGKPVVTVRLESYAGQIERADYGLITAGGRPYDRNRRLI